MYPTQEQEVTLSKDADGLGVYKTNYITHEEGIVSCDAPEEYIVSSSYFSLNKAVVTKTHLAPPTAFCF